MLNHFLLNLKQRYNIRDYKISLVFLVTLISLVGIAYRPKCKTLHLMESSDYGRLSWSDCYVYYLFH